MRTLLATLAALTVALVAPAAAAASEIIDRNATGVKLAVNGKGEALLTYRVRGQEKRVLVWGALNAIEPTRSRAQVKFRLDYSGGWGTYRTKYWQGFTNTCSSYKGPKLAWFVLGCTAKDGSHWAIQSWQRMLPNYGLTPNAQQAVWELRLSHWKGELPKLEIWTDWSWRRWDHIFGRYTYLGKPVYGFASTSVGVPLDTFGRNIYFDTFDSAYGKGWKRENSFLAHTGTGVFCYSINPHDNTPGGPRPAGRGTKYRATVIGPGVTPDVMWQGPAPGPFDAALDAAKNQEIAALNDKLCRPN